MNTIEQIREFANQNPVTWLATATDDQPHVRGMAMWFADETGFHYHTGTQKRLYKQLCDNPKVELGFYRAGEDMSTLQMVRVTGMMEAVEDTELEEKLFADRPWLNAIRQAFPGERVVIFRLAHGEAQYWNMAVNGREKEVAPIMF